MCELDPWIVSPHDAMGMQRTLGRAGGAGGIDDERGILAHGLDRRECIAATLEQLPEFMISGVIFWIGDDDRLQRRQFINNGAHLVDVVAVGDHGLGFGVAKPPGQGIRPELGKQGYAKCTHAKQCYMRECRFRALAKQDTDTIAPADADGSQCIGKPVRELLQFAERKGAHAAAIVFVDESESAAVLFVDRVDAHVEVLRHAMAELGAQFLRRLRLVVADDPSRPPLKINLRRCMSPCLPQTAWPHPAYSDRERLRTQV